MTALFVWAALSLLPGGSEAPHGARALTLVSATPPRPVTVERRRLAHGVTLALTEEPVTLAARTVLAIGEEELVLRVKEPGGASPRTFVIPPGRAPVSLAIGPPVRGGEVFGRLPPRAFRPERLRLTQAARSVDVVPADDGVFAAPGLSPGRYTLVPVYRGGVAGRPLVFVVRDGQTAELLALDVPETGAVRLDLASSLCGEPDLELSLEAPGRPAHRDTIAPGACALEMEGIEPGAWQAKVTRGGARNEPRATAQFVVAPRERVEVALEPVVRVTGTVTAGGGPAPGQRLLFEQAADRWNAMTDARGAYEVLLGPPGEYVVSVLAAKDLPSRSFTRTFVPGDQQEDIELGPGAIEVWIRAEPGTRLDGSVELALFESQGRRLSGRFDVGPEPAVFNGLDYGQYTVTATTASGLRSRNEARVDLSSDAPSATVDLLMARGGGVLRVVGSDGAPLDDARASAGDSPLPQREPGLFDLAGVPAGERLVAHAPDHVPACRLMAGDTADPVVPLPVAESSLTLRLRADAPWRDLLVIGLPGSDCPLAVHDLEPQVQTGDYAVSITLELPRGSFAVAIEGQLHTVSAPGDLEIP
jgi:hypothetical protein